MLETVLKIGKIFRKSEESFKYHRYIRQCPIDTNKRKILRYSIPVDKDFHFKIDEIKEITDENIINNKLFYLTFKTSDADTVTRYVYGDIHYNINKEGKEIGGNYKIEEDVFEKAKETIKENNNETIWRFREGFKKQRNEIESILLQYKTDIEVNSKYNSIFLHFDFENKSYWYNKEELDEIDRLLVNYFFKSENNKEFVLNVMLHRTLCSGNEKNDIQFPDFDIKKKYSTHLFSLEESRDLFYAINYTEKPLIKIMKADINIIVLPQGDNISATEYDKFNKRPLNLEHEVDKENEIAEANNPSEELFDPFFKEEIAGEDIKFDLIFSKTGGMTSPWVDMIELVGIEKSNLQKINERIKKIKSRIQSKYNLELIDSFYYILKDNSKSKKYQSHLCIVLPQIYTETYYNDPMLLPVLIEKTEYNIRSNSEYAFPKENFYFLTLIQNTNKEGENLMKIKESKSYAIGYFLGKLALPFAEWRQDCPIKSFEKSYVGNLSRRIMTLDELIKFKNFIDEKLTVHEKLYKDIKNTSNLLAQKIIDFSGRYSKDECAFGFFESYFEPHENNSENNSQSEDN